jgi:putative Holliday junction resolvase
MRVLAVDVGKRRIGLAISDRTGTLARPLSAITVSAGEGVNAILEAIQPLAREDDGLELIVVGLPVRLDGTATDQTAYVTRFIDELRKRTTIPVVAEDERLTSREAESRLALRERDWRKRKARLDAAAAAVMLQDYLDRTQERR